MICPNCNTENNDNSTNCIACNYQFYESNNIETLDTNHIIEENNITEQPQEETSPIIEEENSNILKNPVSEYKEEVVDEHVNLIVLIKLLIGTIFKPGTTVVEKTKMYPNLKTNLKIFFFFNTITLIFYMISNLFNSCFVKIYDINTSTYTTTFSTGALANVNYARLILIGLLISYGIPAIITLIYYIASFITNKGLSLGRYFSIVTLSLIPLLISACIIAPIVTIFSYYIAVIFVVFGIMYSFIILTTTISDLLVFKDTNQKIIYHTFILTMTTIIIVLIVMLFLKDQLSALNILL